MSDTQIPPSRQASAYVINHIHQLRTGGRDTSWDVASLARLRRSDPSRPGSDPLVWSLVLEGSSEVLSDIPSPTERATHAALVLFAIHQQSKDQPMHEKGMMLGSAVRRLARERAVGGEKLDPAIVRRFQFVALADSFGQRLYHLRQLVHQLRSAQSPIPLDYGGLTTDLYWLARHDYAAELGLRAAELQKARDSADRVRLQWGRDLHRMSRDEQSTQQASNATSTTGAANVH